MYMWLDILTKILVLLVAVVLTVYLISLVAHEAKSHEWYHPACCNEKDCTPVEKIERGDGETRYYSKMHGWITITDEEMQTRTRLHDMFEVLPSKDAQTHICAYKVMTFLDEKGQTFSAPSDLPQQEKSSTELSMLRCLYLPGTS